MKFITVFTPAYNRAYCIHKLYDSLLSQTNQNFKWLVVDDGSTDNTKDLIESWMQEAKLDITYIYKENGGMHTAHNTAYQNIDTELNVCIDSDDYMPTSAIGSIYEEWQKIKHDPKVAGMLGLDETTEGKLIGSKFDHEYEPTNLIDYYQVQGGSGDKKQVWRTALTKAYPAYPEYPEERLVPLDTLPSLICRDYHIIPINKIWATVDYQQGGSSDTIIRQYFQSPKGFRYSRKLNIQLAARFRYRLRYAIHYGVSCIILRDIKSVITNSERFITLVAFPLSIILFFYLLIKRLK